jgi:hypothetical protein
MAQETTYDKVGKIEQFKLWVDYYKHLTTLSTGSIVLMATFMEKLFSQPRWKASVIIALLGFLFSILGSVLVMSILVVASRTFAHGGDMEDAEGRLGSLGIFASWIGFCVGIVALTAFVVRNLLG